MKKKTIVVKVGTRILTDSNGKLNLFYIRKIVQQISDLKKEGHKILLVSSGAIGIGMGKLNLVKKPVILAKKQAIAAIGQSSLIQFYEKLFLKNNLIVAQILLTREDLGNRKRYLNSRNTLLEILKYGVVPIINENDTVATEEIEFGDNDTLSALVASLIGADLLIILSTVDGLYSKDPRGQKNKDNKIKLINYIPKITEEIFRKASPTTNNLSIGGMITKLQAASIAVDSGVNVVIANGKKEKILSSIIKEKNIGTYIPAEKISLSSRKKWLAYGPISQGVIIIDNGAKKAIIDFGKSLLPAGIIDVKGFFNIGEMIKIKDQNNNFIARGLANYNSTDLDKIKGFKNAAVVGLLGYFIKTEVIHRDNLVLNSKYRI